MGGAVPKATIEKDRAALVALKKLKGYAPSNVALSVEALNALEADLRAAEENELLSTNALGAYRDARTTAGWALHNRLLNVKALVSGDYGPNSDEVQALGLKKKSDYRRRTRSR